LIVSLRPTSAARATSSGASSATAVLEAVVRVLSDAKRDASPPAQIEVECPSQADVYED